MTTEAPQGYHFLGQKASLITDSSGSIKATELLLVSNKGTQKDRYASFFAQSGDTCYCALGCSKTFSRYKNDMKGVMSHMRTSHSNLLHPEDRKATVAADGQTELDGTATNAADGAPASDDGDGGALLEAVKALSGQMKLNISGQLVGGGAKKIVTAAITQIKKGISNEMADVIMHRGAPFTFVEDRSMQSYTRNIMRLVNPSVKPELVHFHCRDTITKIVKERLSSEEATMLGDLKRDILGLKVPMFSIANDCTTSVGDTNYCATCVYVIVDNSGRWEMREYALDYSEFGIPHTRARAFEQAHDTIRRSMPYLDHLPLSDFIVAGVFDCAKNTPREIFMRNKSIAYDVKCAGHRYSTACKKLISACPDLQAGIECVESVMKTIKNSSNNKLVLKEVMTNKGLRFKVPRLPHDIRWMSKSSTLKRARELQAPIVAIKDERNEEGDLRYWSKMKFKDGTALANFETNVDDWSVTYANVLTHCYPFMEKMLYWTRVLEAGSKVTISLVNYSIADMLVVGSKLEARVRNLFKGPAGEGTRTALLEILEKMKGVMNDVFVKKDFADNELMVIAKFLDPRVALEPGGTSELLMPDVRNEDGEKLSPVDTMIRFYSSSPICEKLFGVDEKWEPKQQRGTGTNRHLAHPMLAGIAMFTELSNFESSVADFRGEVTRYLRDLSNLAPNRKDAAGRDIQNEFDYFSLLTDSRNDPLAFWSSNRTAYPRLYEIAKIILSIPAMAAGTERMHSSSKRVFGVDRASLGAVLGGRLALSYHRFRQGGSSSESKVKWYPFGTIITLDEAEDEDDPEDDPDPAVVALNGGDDLGYDSYDDEADEMYPDLVGPADAYDVATDADDDYDAAVDETTAAADDDDDENNALAGDAPYRYTVGDIVFVHEDYEVHEPTEAEVAAAAVAAASKTRSGRSIRRKLQHDEMYDDNRSKRRRK